METYTCATINCYWLSAQDQLLFPFIEFGSHYELLICGNIYLASNVMKLSVLEQKLWPFIDFDGHLEFHHSNTPEVILMYFIELLLCEKPSFATNCLMLAVLEKKL